MAKKAPARKCKPAPGPHWRWWLVECVRTDARKFRLAGDVYPWFWLRLTSVIGKTPVESQWRITDVPLSSPLRVIVRAPAWALAVEVTWGLASPNGPVPAVVTDLGHSDPRPRNPDLDHPYYNVDTFNL